MPAHIRHIAFKTKSGKIERQNITCVHCWEEPHEHIEVDLVDNQLIPSLNDALGLTQTPQAPEMVAGEFLSKYEARIYQCQVCGSLIIDFRGQKYMLLKMIKGSE